MQVSGLIDMEQDEARLVEERESVTEGQNGVNQGKWLSCQKSGPILTSSRMPEGEGVSIALLGVYGQVVKYSSCSEAESNRSEIPEPGCRGKSILVACRYVDRDTSIIGVRYPLVLHLTICIPSSSVQNALFTKW